MAPLRLLLLRHAKSAWDDARLADAERPLAPRGVRSAHRTALLMHRKHKDVRVALALSSPAARARETLAIARAAWPALAKAKVRIHDALYDNVHGDYEGIGESTLRAIADAARIHDAPPSGTLVVVGHNFGFEQAASALVGGAEPVVLKTGAAALLEAPPTSVHWSAALRDTGAWHVVDVVRDNGRGGDGDASWDDVVL